MLLLITLLLLDVDKLEEVPSCHALQTVSLAGNYFFIYPELAGFSLQYLVERPHIRDWLFVSIDSLIELLLE